MSFTQYAAPAFTVESKVDIAAAIKPATRIPFKPIGTS